MPKKYSRHLQILSANAQKSIAYTDSLLELAARRRISLVCVQEPAVIRSKVRRHPGFTMISSGDPECRTAIYIDKRSPFSALHDPLHFAVSVSFSGFQIVCLYIHPRDELAFPAWRFLRSIRASQSHIIVGDFNTKHSLWDPRADTNPRGEPLATWIAASGLVIHNPPGETHNRGGIFDPALGPARAFARFAHWVSDHRALVVSVPKAPPQLSHGHGSPWRRNVLDSQHIEHR